MSAFRRRTTATGHARAPPEGVKAAPYDAPVPLLSTGIAALDDIMCGGGVLAGSVLGFVPCAGTANEPAAMLGAPMLGVICLLRIMMQRTPLQRRTQTSS